MARLPEPLRGSRLGERDYWDESYGREIANHAADPADEGTVWFADSGAEERTIGQLERLAERGLLDRARASFADVGSGNGHLLFRLRDAGWQGPMLGLDYSERAVELGRAIADTRRRGSAAEDAGTGHSAAVRFVQHDVMLPLDGAGPFDCVLDKGTFDAVSLSGGQGGGGGGSSSPCSFYALRVRDLLKPGGVALVTSCNWTEHELRTWFDRPDTELAYLDSAHYPRFSFGGVPGQTVVTLSFQRRHNGVASRDIS